MKFFATNKARNSNIKVSRLKWKIPS